MVKQTILKCWLAGAVAVAVVALPSVAQARFAPPDVGPPIVTPHICPSDPGHHAQVRVNAAAMFVGGSRPRLAARHHHRGC
ncbi:MAG TPA: hypothetical protein VFD88_06460 [Clostridia bacterium]|nr:hypothetical protein [Clostridia bacterium]